MFPQNLHLSPEETQWSHFPPFIVCVPKQPSKCFLFDCVRPFTRNHSSEKEPRCNHLRVPLRKWLEFCVHCTFPKHSLAFCTCFFRSHWLCVQRWNQCWWRCVPSASRLSCSSGESFRHFGIMLHLHSVLDFKVYIVLLLRYCFLLTFTT